MCERVAGKSAFWGLDKRAREARRALTTGGKEGTWAQTVRDSFRKFLLKPGGWVRKQGVPRLVRRAPHFARDDSVSGVINRREYGLRREYRLGMVIRSRRQDRETGSTKFDY
jgi:hypothetical protein